MLIALVATTAVTYRGQDYQPGEFFEASPIDAASLTYRKVARFAEPSRATEPPKRKYRRRDLQAEK